MQVQPNISEARRILQRLIRLEMEQSSVVSAKCQSNYYQLAKKDERVRDCACKPNREEKRHSSASSLFNLSIQTPAVIVIMTQMPTSSWKTLEPGSRYRLLLSHKSVSELSHWR